ncbi:polysaccharide deacetylase family protein [Paenibacillus sp. PAMC21692]|uniref:polysaccharide deacetylase family protein n=1 Tax=Paenibacillus sp. PAMC21692 TaxID=2762320 RepID=UPI00164E9D1D|nr:polysaccharide deacetylase family protein [Paenibacillus sp. PAMC21692]QNK56598.1 polysaccharide deacetylase family protein [Paenibacillus sp. PAMC21692]
MDRTKKRRRRRLVLLMVIVAVFFWVAGCAAGKSMSMGMSAIIPSVVKGGETIQGGTASGSGNGGGGAADKDGTLTGVGGSGDQGGSGEQHNGHGTGSGNQGGSSGNGSSGGSAGTGGDNASGNGTEGANGQNGNGDGGKNGSTGNGVGIGAGGGTGTGAGTGAGNGNGSVNGGTGSGNFGGKPGEGANAGGQPDKPSVPAEQGNGENGKKLVALTFDDGPDKKYTTAILDILKEKGVKATFFVVGQQVKLYPEVLQRIADEGHTIGNHSQNHKDLKKQEKSVILEQINKTDEAIRDVIGEKPTLFRAPYGSMSDTVKQILKAQDRVHTGWTVDTRDWAGTSPADMRKMIIQDTKPNGIILMHSFGSKHIKNTVEALPGIIDDLHKLGYTLVTVDELP